MPVIPYIRATHSDGQDWTAAKANLIEAGVNDAHYMAAVRAYHNANQATTNATWTTLALNSERFDQAGNAADTQHDNTTNNSRLTCKYAGVYQITGHFRFASSTGGNSRYGRIRLNGATVIAEGGNIYNPVSAGAVLVVVTTTYALAVNDYVELQAYQDSSTSLNVDVQANFSPEFMMHRVA